MRRVLFCGCLLLFVSCGKKRTQDGMPSEYKAIHKVLQSLKIPDSCTRKQYIDLRSRVLDATPDSMKEQFMKGPPYKKNAKWIYELFVAEFKVHIKLHECRLKKLGKSSDAAIKGSKLAEELETIKHRLWSNNIEVKEWQQRLEKVQKNP